MGSFATIVRNLFPLGVAKEDLNRGYIIRSV
jgi:hypothetical protein